MGIEASAMFITVGLTLAVVLLGARCSSKNCIRRLQRRPSLYVVLVAAAVSASTFFGEAVSKRDYKLYPLLVRTILLGPPIIGPFVWIPAAIWWGILRWGIRIGIRSPGEGSCC